MRTARALIVVAFVLTTSSASAQSLGFPPGKWWTNPRTVEQLGLSRDQQAELDSIFRRSAEELIDRKAELEKSTLRLRNLLDRDNLDRRAILAAAEEVSDARAAMFERELTLLVDMRAVLSTEQWNRVREAIHHKMTGGEPDRPRRPGRRHPPGRR